MKNTAKPLKLHHLIALVVGNIVGSGIFLLPDDLAKYGAASIWAWLFTILGTVLLAQVLVSNSRIVEKTGGPYAYAKEGFGKFIGFQTAYCHWISMWVATAALAIAAVNYIAILFPILSPPKVTFMLALLAIWMTAAVNMFGMRAAGVVQVITVILKLLPILLIAVCGWFYFHPSYIWQDFGQSFGISSFDYRALSKAAGLTLWAFIGVESATIPYASIKNPKRDIPLATFIGALIAGILYIVTSTVIMGIFPKAELVNISSPFVYAATVMFGNFGKWIMVLGAAISCLGALNGWTCLYGQVAMAASEDRLFPGIFRIRNKFGVPALGIGVTAILSSFILYIALKAQLAEHFQIIIAMASFAALVPYLYSATASILLIQKQKLAFAVSTNKYIFYFISAFLAAIYSFWALCGAGERLIFYGSILLFTSVILYAWESRENIG